MAAVPAAATRQRCRLAEIGFPRLLIAIVFLFFSLLLARPGNCSVKGPVLFPGFNASQILWIDNDGLFLRSGDSNFSFGFVAAPSEKGANAFYLSVIYRKSSAAIWTAYLDGPVSATDNFFFGADGVARLELGGRTVWSAGGGGADEMVLLNSGNLVMRNKGKVVWQSFDHPTDTLVSGQRFTPKMRLRSKPNERGLVCFLEFYDEDLVLRANYSPPQPYWTASRDARFTLNAHGKGAPAAVLVGSSWNVFDAGDSAGPLISQFRWTTAVDNASIAAVTLQPDGALAFYVLGAAPATAVLVPSDTCDLPEPCDPYSVCFRDGGGGCRCPVALTAQSDLSCGPNVSSELLCGRRGGAFELLQMDDGVGYFATAFVPASATGTSLDGCKAACQGNCSCVALFFDGGKSNCFLFDQIGSLRRLTAGGGGDGSSAAYVKVPLGKATRGGGGAGGGGRGHAVAVALIVVGTVAAAAGLVCVGVRIQRRTKQTTMKKKRQNKLSWSSSLGAPLGAGSDEEDEEGKYLGSLSGMPVRFSYAELREATDDFAVRLGGGGFGSVYLGRLRDGSQVAVKKLEGLHQGAKEFRAEVTTIGSIHHIHLVRLRGFCAEGAHRLLAYEYLSKGSLDKWIFRSRAGAAPGEGLDWEKRFGIALGTAKGLAYLHQDCESKIVHCDIKPENVLLGDNFEAKVSDFGLAKMMTREQSHVFTTMRGTRGYLAPEWITNYAISEKSDVYSFGMVLLEIIGGRKNFDPSETSEKAHFPSYAFRMMEEGRLREVLDTALREPADQDGRVERAIKVALWCIQEDMALRPSMARVVQMLEGVTEVPQPPASSQMGFRLYASLIKSMSDNDAVSSSAASAAPSDWNSEALLSAVRLSGPR
ncbi:S-domain-2 5 [Wolffia australiana]